MSLTKESFEVAKKKARERIAQWVEDAKSCGISRLQEQFDYSFKRYEWLKKKSANNAQKFKRKKDQKLPSLSQKKEKKTVKYNNETKTDDKIKSVLKKKEERRETGKNNIHQGQY